jgi:hypothetical protein
MSLEFSRAAKPSDLPIQAAIKCELADSLHDLLASVGRYHARLHARDSDETHYRSRDHLFELVTTTGEIFSGGRREKGVPSVMKTPSRDEAARPDGCRRLRQLVSTGVLYRKASSSICLTRKSATSAREMNPQVQSRGSTNAR